VINLPLGAHPQILVWLSAGALIRDMKIIKDVIESTGNLAIIIIKFSSKLLLSPESCVGG
jgi:hypothetical protein